MGGRQSQTFKKTQKEQRRKEKREAKLARKLDRKLADPALSAGWPPVHLDVRANWLAKLVSLRPDKRTGCDADGASIRGGGDCEGG